MEDIYTIKVRTNPDPRELYPSERRYSASTVLGLGVVHVALAITSLLLASLSLSANGGNHSQSLNTVYQNFTDFNPAILNSSENSPIERDSTNDDMAFLDEDETSEKNKTPEEKIDSFQMEDIYRPFVSLTLLPCVMSLGALSAGLTGILAWKRWYIDQNIRWFFFMSSISTLTSLACLTVTALTIGIVNDQNPELSGLHHENAFIFSFNDNNVFVDRLQHSDSEKPNLLTEKQNIPNLFSTKSGNSHTPNIRLVLAVNVLIASILEFIWSVLSTKISWKGMKNNYPDDIVLSRGKIEVNTIKKGNKSKTIAPDILNHHPTKRKFAKYFPKKEDDFLPKAESNIEYRERVNRFLSSNVSESD